MRVVTNSSSMPPLSKAQVIHNYKYYIYDNVYSVDVQACIFHIPRQYAVLMNNKSKAILNESVVKDSLEPGISVQLIGTSAMGTPSLSARYISSTSKIHLSRWMLGTIRCAALRLNILKPHCVSLTTLTPQKPTKSLKIFIKTSLNTCRYDS